LDKLRPPFNITTLSAKAALAALSDEEFLRQTLELNFNEMPRYEEFARSLGIEYIDSYTNFITYKFPDGKDSKQIAQIMLERGVIVRNLSGYGVNGIRITIGQEIQNSKFFDIFSKAYKQGE
jgi:histidinol-phosphate aminotransferase